jgi:CHAT domain-containing protein/tetratricopeptide (TPR) repeat protein
LKRLSRTVLLVLAAGMAAACDRPSASVSAAPQKAAPTRSPAVQTLPLSPGSSPLRPLPAGSIHAYQIELPADTFVHATFLQQGVDVAIDVFAPGHRRLFRIDSPNESDGPEELHLVTESPGVYQFEVSPLTESAGQSEGQYQPILEAVRPAAGTDRSLAAADQSFYEAREIDSQPARFWEAVAKYEQALRLYQEAGEQWHPAYTFLCLARIDRAHGRLRESLDFALRAEGLFSALHDRHFLIISRNETGTCAQALAEFDRAAAAYQSALDLARQAGEENEQAVSLHNLGTLYQSHGQPWQALHSFRAALALWQRQTGARARANEAETLTGIGWVYTSTGQWPRAVDAHQQALRLRNRLGDPRQRAVSLTQIGNVWLRADPPRALPYMQRAWELLETVDSPRDQAAALNGLGLALRSIGRSGDAQAAYKKALQLYRTPPDPGGQAVTWNNLGWTQVSLHRPDDALESFGQGLQLAQQARNPMAEARALLGLATAEHERGNATAAQVRAEASLAIVESLRAAVTRPDLQTSYLAANESAYGLLIRVLMESHRRQPGSGFDLQALARSEQERARVLLDALRESREQRADLKAGIPSAILNRRRALLAEIGLLDAKRRNPGTTLAESTAAEQQLAERLERLNELNAEIRRPRPWKGETALAEQRQRLLGRDTVLLEYALGTPRSYLWLVSADAVQSFELPGRDTLDPLLQAAYDQLSSAHGAAPASPGPDPLLVLSRHLLGPVARQLAGKRLLIAADGLQQSIPFAALPDPEGRQGPLVLRYEIVSIPSLAVLAELRARRTERQPAPLPLALVADPVFDPTDSRFPPSTRPAPSVELQDLFLPRLPKSRDEAEAIAALLPPGQAFQAFDFQASSNLVTSGRLAPYRILHFATHGALRLDHPELSALVLSRFDSGGAPRDGYLRVPDLENLDLSADLVVLSACSTALGPQTPGEGVVGLPQAFFTAGASQVLVSLWQVEEESTAALMTTFYRHLLLDHHPPGQALREAQLAIRAHPQWSAPRYWAGFVLQGDWQ